MSQNLDSELVIRRHRKIPYKEYLKLIEIDRKVKDLINVKT